MVIVTMWLMEPRDIERRTAASISVIPVTVLYGLSATTAILYRQPHIHCVDERLVNRDSQHRERLSWRINRWPTNTPNLETGHMKRRPDGDSPTMSVIDVHPHPASNLMWSASSATVALIALNRADRVATAPLWKADRRGSR